MMRYICDSWENLNTSWVLLDVQLLQQKYHRLDDLPTREISLSWFRSCEVQDQGTSRFGVWWVYTSWFIGSCLLAVSSHGGGGEGTLTRALTLFMVGFTIWPIHLPKGPPPNIILWGLAFNIWTWEGHKHSV